MYAVVSGTVPGGHVLKAFVCHWHCLSFFIEHSEFIFHFKFGNSLQYPLQISHPNVVKLVEVLDDPIDDSLYLVFELVKQGEVLSIPTDTPLSEERAWAVFRDVVLGLEYCEYTVH